jgi:hypothetical protein
MECANVWRVARGLSAVPIPQMDAVPVGKDEASRVTRIEWSPEGAKPEPPFESRVASLKGKRLNQEDLVKLFTDFARRPQPGTAGLEFKAIKDEDLTGVRLVIKLIPGAPPTEEQGWNVNERVILGRKSLHGSSGGGTLEVYSATSQWEDFAEAIKQALTGTPETPFEISVRILAGKSHVN